jgi:hypothetical protein
MSGVRGAVRAGCCEKVSVRETTMSDSDLSETVLDFLLYGRKSEPFELINAERHDQLRQLALSEQKFGKR